ncbi:MAG: P-loop NTPase [candidate division Zixibacteria bacterium]|nr:P-loop NTPase [candidate division Zixibacteria bacterium]
MIFKKKDQQRAPETDTARGAGKPAAAPYRSSSPSLENIKYVVAIASGKGGVGKSTVTSNLAMALSATGAKVGLLDADIYGPSQPGMMGASGQKPDVADNKLQPVTRHGVKFVSMGLLLDEDSPVVWRAPMATKMISQFIGAVNWGKLDYLLVDLPPGTGDVQITLAQQAPLTGAVIVTTPQDVALDVAKKGLKMFEQVNVPILGIIENMSGFTCSHCGEVTAIFKEGGGKALAEKLKVPYLGSIPLDPQIMMGGEEGLPVTGGSADSPAAKSFTATAARLVEQVVLEAESAALEPVNVELTTEGDVDITWPGGKQEIYRAYDLRVNCPCAACVDEDSGKRTLDVKHVALDVRITSFRTVGRYALAFDFSDRHNTGIYRYERLRDLNPSSESFSV